MKKLAVWCLLIVMMSSLVYAELCEASSVKQSLRKNLYLFFIEPGSNTLPVSELKDLLSFYLNIPSDINTVDCSAVGAVSGIKIADIVTAGETSPDIIPSCADFTSYAECAPSKPLYCYAGTLVEKCGECGCKQGFTCSLDDKCVPLEDGVSCSKDSDCGASGLVGNYYCSADKTQIMRNNAQYTCLNPSTTSSSCQASNNSQVLTACNTASGQSCVDGYSGCLSISTSDDYCVDADDQTAGPTPSAESFFTSNLVTGIYLGKYFQYYDSCDGGVTGSNVIEQFCNGNMRSNYTKVCNDGCYIGKCKVSCIDTDPGTVYELKGYTYGELGDGSKFNVSDVCIDNKKLSEVLCDTWGDDIYDIIPVDCAYGCSDGACNAGPAYCQDTDGENKFLMGYVNYTYGIWLNYNLDVCWGSSQVKELICSGTNAENKYLTCDAGYTCFNGACVDCSSGICSGSGNSCFDTDEETPSNINNYTSWGNVPSVNGYTYSYSYGSFYNYSDYCADSTRLIEHYCYNGAAITLAAIDCLYGCNNGACNPGQNSCYDSDSGYNYLFKGYAYGIQNSAFVNRSDYCINQSHIIEQTCYDGSIIYPYQFDCTIIGKKCSDGACV
ncbi:hypothetical protein J4234_06265 [Candidatus Woesearchaeota archaeon]|nr:hypothetical protein [Candidatus Woesearchaeota archaeon]